MGIWIFTLSALCLEIMLLPFFATSLPLYQIGEDIPASHTPNITFVFNFEPKIEVHYNEDGMSGQIDPSLTILGMFIGIAYVIIGRYLQSKRDKDSTN